MNEGTVNDGNVNDDNVQKPTGEQSASHRVFISYSTVDKEKALALCDFVEAAGIKCWIACRDIPSGESWPKHILKALGQSEIVVLLLSSNSDASAEVEREITLARGARIVPVRIEDVTPKGGLKYFFATTHWLDAFVGPFESHLPKLVKVLNSPGDTSLLSAPQSKVLTPAEIESEIHKIDWTLAELEHYDGPLRVPLIDDVFEPVVTFAAPLHESGQWEACAQIYEHAAEGVVRVLQNTPAEHSVAWPFELEQLQQKLLALKTEAKTQTPEEPTDSKRKVQQYHRLFVDFLDRVTESSPSMRKITWITAITLLAISIASLILTYYPSHTTLTWEMRYAYAMGPDAMRCGMYLEASRSIGLGLVLVYFVEILFRSEFGRLMLDWSFQSWKRPWVWPSRLFGLVFFTCSVWTVSEHVLVNAPSKEWMWANSKYEQLRENPGEWADIINGWSKEGGINWLKVEATPEFRGNITPYRWYLPYCLVNYAGYGVLLLSVILFSILTDASRLYDERQGLYRSLVDQHLPDAVVDREFLRFFDICFRHTQRYITLLVLLSGVIVYETTVTSCTLSEAGWNYELTASVVLVLAACLWGAILIHFYDSAFQRCCDEKRRRLRLSKDRSQSEEWEQSWNTSRFLMKCFVNLRSGVAIILNLIPFTMFVLSQSH